MVNLFNLYKTGSVYLYYRIIRLEDGYIWDTAANSGDGDFGAATTWANSVIAITEDQGRYGVAWPSSAYFPNQGNFDIIVYQGTLGAESVADTVIYGLSNVRRPFIAERAVRIS